MIFWIIIFNVIILTKEILTAEDPCYTTNKITEWQRSVAYAGSNNLCDNLLTVGWYRVVSGAGERMPTDCPVGGFRCSTITPIWLSDSSVNSGEDIFPTGGRTVNRTAFAADISGDCFSSRIDIKIKDCGCYYVYYLHPTNGCYSSYCFGDQLPCQDGYTSPNGFTPGCVNPNGNYIPTTLTKFTC